MSVTHKHARRLTRTGDKGAVIRATKCPHTHHFNHVYFGLYAQVVEERLQILAHLHTVVLYLRHCKYAQLRLRPDAVLA